MEKNIGKKTKKENKRDFFVRIVTVQLILFTVIFGSVLLTIKLSDDGGAEIKRQFAEYMRRDMSYEDIKAIFEKNESTVPPVESVTETPIERTTQAYAEYDNIDAISQAYAFEDGTEVNLADADTEAEEYLASLIVREPVFPVEGRISSGFGGRISPISHISEKHRGTDIAAPEGTQIKAVFGGKVTLVDRTPGRGYFLILDHGEGAGGRIETLYQHCSSILVTEGTIVRAGETIALVGSTGDATGPHLHLEYRIDGECVDAIENIFGGVYEA